MMLPIVTGTRLPTAAATVSIGTSAALICAAAHRITSYNVCYTKLLRSYTEQVSYCGKSYFTTKRGRQWIAAHTKARHVLLVRYHQAKGKYKVVCGTKPKGPARKPVRKKTKTPPKPAGKSS